MTLPVNLSTSAWILCICSLLVVIVSAKYDDNLIVNLPNGSPVHGLYKTSLGGRGIRAFKNIPYAESPVGDLRFADPVPKAAWTGELKNQKDVILCPQEEKFFFDGMYMGQEDCLYLNVYVPLVREIFRLLFFSDFLTFLSLSGLVAKIEGTSSSHVLHSRWRIFHWCWR